MSLYDDVYGLTYKRSEEAMLLLNEALTQRVNKGFSDAAELAEWAHAHHLDKVVFSNMAHTFLCVSHKGELMLPSVFKNYYGSILFYYEEQGQKKYRVDWAPEGFEYYSKAYIVGEQSDGMHKPLYYRDYNMPTGYYSEARDAYNIAKPFPVFAKETGRDTSHIYTYIQHLAGECAFHLLAWLRAKMLYPTQKTQVVPIIVSRAQGSGKSTFAEVICKGLFGKDNVLVTDQYDATARFNADYADALIVCHEEKEEQDRRNPASSLKSRATATTIRKENKGVDPIYQDSYTDYILTTNKEVPIKFEGREDQRRFMVMEADEGFTRKTSSVADEVFTMLYGFDSNFRKAGVPFVEDYDLIAQFKHELFTREDIAKVSLRNFPHTAAYNRCFSLPRTNEATEAESVLRALAPFIRETLRLGQVVMQLEDISLSDIVNNVSAVRYVPAYGETPAYVALCRPLVFYEMGSMKPMSHSVVERTLNDAGSWMTDQYELSVMPDTEPFPQGFPGVAGRYRAAPVARICRAEDTVKPSARMPYIGIVKDKVVTSEGDAIYFGDTSALRTAGAGEQGREGRRFRVNGNFWPDKMGEYETVNELPAWANSLKDKTRKVLYMDTFLLESDEPTAMQRVIEEARAKKWLEAKGDMPIPAQELYSERLELAWSVSKKLFDEGKVCRIVYSGAKSYHLLVRVEDAPKDLVEYKWLHAWLCTTFTDRLNFDKSTSDPARLTRSPITKERITQCYGVTVIGKQELVCEDWTHIFRFNWRPFYEQWLERPLSPLEEKSGRPLYPTKEEYKEAAEAIVSGTFWSSGKYDGDRQRLFFPAYRLLRAMGWSHDALWNEVIEQGLGGYKKRQDVSYWKTRATSELVLSIDRDIDIHEKEILGGRARVD